MTSENDQIAKGITLIIGSVIIMALADAVVKWASAEMTVWQVFAIRSLFGAAIVGAVIWWQGGQFLPHHMGWALLRSAFLVLTWLTFYAALPVLDLSVVAVAAYTNPIFITLLTALMVGQQVTRWQWGGVFLGFLGVIAILRPGSDAFSWFIILPLLAAVFYAISMVLTRTKCRNENPITLALNLHGAFICTGLAVSAVLAGANLNDTTQAAFPFLLGDWALLTPTLVLIMAGLGGLSAIYFAGVARAYQIAPSPIIATFDYVYLISAALWGYVFFMETPDRYTLMGMALIAAAGLMVAKREA